MSGNIERRLEGYSALCAAVVELAVKDYKRALRRLKRKPTDQEALHTKFDCERFFRKDISFYSDIDGEKIMQKIQEEVEGEG